MILAEKQTPKSMDINREKIENPEINQGIYGQLIYKKGVKNIQWWKDSFYVAPDSYM